MTPPAASGAARAAAPQRAPRRETERTRPPLRVVDPKGGRRRNPLAGINAGRVGTIAGIALFVSLFALAAFQTVIIKAQANIDATNTEIVRQETLQRDLSLMRADLSSPERITAEANALGLIPPESVTYLQPGADDDVAATLAPETTEPDSAAGAGGLAGQTAP